MWAYPVEYKDKTTASQNTQNANQFTYPYYGSPVYWVTKGYAVLDDAAFPIIGEEKQTKPESLSEYNILFIETCTITCWVTKSQMIPLENNWLQEVMERQCGSGN